MTNSFKPYNPNDLASSTFQVIAPEGQTSAAQGNTWVNTVNISTSNMYSWSDDITATDPEPQKVKINNADESLATELYINETTLTGGSVQAIGDKVAIGDLIRVQQYGATGNFITFNVSDIPTDNGDWWTIPVTVLENAGGFTDGVDVGLDYWATSARAENICVQMELDGKSVAATQDPTGKGPSNAIKIEFGPAQNGALDHVQIDALGNVLFNKTSLYRVKAAVQMGRIGAGSVSELLIRLVINGTQYGRTVAAKLDNANIISPFNDDLWLNFEQGDAMYYEIMRDESGNDSGGLIGQDVTVEPGSWNQDPCAELIIERLISI